jgi:hypothetical protein
MLAAMWRRSVAITQAEEPPAVLHSSFLLPIRNPKRLRSPEQKRAVKAGKSVMTQVRDLVNAADDPEGNGGSASER